MKIIRFKAKFKKVIEDPELSDQEKLKFIMKNTIEHYNSGNRCNKESNDGCAYHPSAISKTIYKTEGCAIGRLLTETSAKALDTLDSMGTIDSVIENSLKGNKLKIPEFIVKHERFFDSLQNLHDTTHCWDANGITESGKEKVSRIEIIINRVKS